MVSKLTAERLQQVVRVLESDLPGKFDIKTFKCGSAGCALGWAAQDPWFIRRGFKLQHDNGDRYVVTYQKLGSLDSASDFFQISRLQATNLFYACGYYNEPSKNEVISRLKSFIKEQSS